MVNTGEEELWGSETEPVQIHVNIYLSLLYF